MVDSFDGQAVSTIFGGSVMRSSDRTPWLIFGSRIAQAGTIRKREAGLDVRAR